MAGYTLIDDEPPKGYTLIDDGKKGSGSVVLDTANAVSTGFMKGLTNLAGLPVDTVANVIDLGKAAAGSGYIAATGKAPPRWLELTDRKHTPLTGANIRMNVDSVAPVLINPINPSYEGGFAEATGAGLTGVIRPSTFLQGVNQAVLGVTGNVLGKATYDATGNDALAITAGMIPGATQDAGVRLTKRGVRGGETGRRVMEQRIQDLKNAGVDNPTLGLASGNTFLGGLENVLQSTPGAVTIMQNARNNAVGGLQQKVTDAADLSSTNRGSIASGQSIQNGAKTFRDNFKTAQTGLYSNLDQFIPPMTPSEVSGTRAALANLNQEIPTMPQLSKQFMNGRIQAIESAFNSDLAGTPALPPSTIPFTTRQIVGTDAAGMPVYKNVVINMQSPGIPAGPDKTTAPWTALKQTRTLVGNEIADTNLASSVPRSKWNPLYGALSSDMETAANAAGPQATTAFNRASNFTRAGVGRLDAIDPIVTRSTPEGSFSALSNTLKDNVTAFQAVKKSLPEGARGDFAGTIIERLGTAKPGQQDNTGGVFSPETFLTNWNKMSDKGKAELLSGFPNSAQVRQDIEAVAKATSMMRDNSKIWSNPSGTAARGAAMGYLGLLGGAGGSLLTPWAADPRLIGAAAALPVGANLAARAVTSPTVLNSMASKTYVDPRILGGQINSLMAGGLLEYPQDK